MSSHVVCLILGPDWTCNSAAGMLQFVVVCNMISVGVPPYHMTTATWMQGLTVALRAVCLAGEGNGWVFTHGTAFLSSSLAKTRRT